MKASLRPYLPADAPLLARIFQESIEVLAEDDYSPDQRAAWGAAAEDATAFTKRLAGGLTIVVLADGGPVGFASLAGADKLDLLYVHPDYAGQGLGAMLADALEKLAGARGAAHITADASDNAVTFFEKRGYVAQSRNTLMVGDEWLANTTMRKAFAPKGDAP
jgi:putative acetyltransferase